MAKRGVSEIEVGEGMNNEVVVRANKRFKTILQAHQLFEAPQQLKPESVLPSEWNRTPNMAYVHFDIGPKMGTDGFFPNRAQPYGDQPPFLRCGCELDCAQPGAHAGQ